MSGDLNVTGDAYVSGSLWILGPDGEPCQVACSGSGSFSCSDLNSCSVSNLAEFGGYRGAASNLLTGMNKFGSTFVISGAGYIFGNNENAIYDAKGFPSQDNTTTGMNTGYTSSVQIGGFRNFMGWGYNNAGDVARPTKSLQNDWSPRGVYSVQIGGTKNYRYDWGGMYSAQVNTMSSTLGIQHSNIGGPYSSNLHTVTGFINANPGTDISSIGSYLATHVTQLGGASHKNESIGGGHFATQIGPQSTINIIRTGAAKALFPSSVIYPYGLRPNVSIGGHISQTISHGQGGTIASNWQKYMQGGCTEENITLGMYSKIKNQSASVMISAIGSKNGSQQVSYVNAETGIDDPSASAYFPLGADNSYVGVPGGTITLAANRGIYMVGSLYVTGAGSGQWTRITGNGGGGGGGSFSCSDLNSCSLENLQDGKNAWTSFQDLTGYGCNYLGAHSPMAMTVGGVGKAFSKNWNYNVVQTFNPTTFTPWGKTSGDAHANIIIGGARNSITGNDNGFASVAGSIIGSTFCALSGDLGYNNSIISSASSDIYSQKLGDWEAAPWRSMILGSLECRHTGLGFSSDLILSSQNSEIRAVDTRENFHFDRSALHCSSNVIIGAWSGIIEQNISNLDWGNSSKNASEHNMILGGVGGKITNQGYSTLITQGSLYSAHTGFDHAGSSDTYGVPGYTITIGAPRGTFVTGSLFVIGDGGLNLDLDYLPTSDPSIRGQVYVDGGTLKVSL